MSAADAPDTLTPLMRLRRRRRTRWLFGAVLTVVIGSLAGIVLSVNHGRNFARLVSQFGLDPYLPKPHQAAPPPAQRYRRSDQISLIPPRLTARAIFETGGFSTSPALPAEARCMGMGQNGAEPPSFQETSNGWECILSLEVGEAVDEPSVLFIQAKGASGDSLRTFRAKLSFLATEHETGLIRLALESIDRFGLAFSPESRRYIEALLTDERNASSILENYRIVFERERGDERRFNLIITPRPSTAQCPAPGSGIAGASLQSSTLAVPLGCLGVPASSRLSLFGPIQPD